MDPRLEKILKLPPFKRIMILGAFLAAVIAAFMFLLFLPGMEEYQTLQKSSQSLETKLQQDRRIAADLPKFKAEYEKMQKQMEAALTELPNQNEIPTLLTNISSLARDNGLNVLRFRPAKETPKGFYAEVPVELKLVGSYHEMAMFFNAVGNLARIVNINNLTIGGAKPGAGKTSVNIDCMAVTFRFIEEVISQPGKKATRPGKGAK